MASVFQDIIDAFKTAVTKLEDIIKTVISKVRSFSIEAGQRIAEASRGLINSIKTKISRLIQAFKERLNNLKTNHPSPSPKQAVATFGDRIRKAARTAGNDIDIAMDKFRRCVGETLKLTGDAIKDAKNSVVLFTKDATNIVENVIKDVAESLKDVGEEILNTFKKTESDIVKDIEIDSKFVFTHSLTIAEAATISILPPIAVVGFIGSAVVLAGAIYF